METLSPCPEGFQSRFKRSLPCCIDLPAQAVGCWGSRTRCQPVYDMSWVSPQQLLWAFNRCRELQSLTAVPEVSSHLLVFSAVFFHCNSVCKRQRNALEGSV